MNPYAKHLGGADAMEIVAGTAGKIEDLVRRIGPVRSDEPRAPGKWSPRETVCHLADTEITFAFRLRQATAEDDHVIQPFDQDKWGAAYRAYDLESALATFAALRNWNVLFLRSLGREAFSRKVTHPERGEMTVQTIVETMAGHDINHISQLMQAA